MASRFALLLAGAMAFVVAQASAAELAILRNGFSIRHERRQVMGVNTRLFLGQDNSSFMDVPTADITGYEKDLTLPPAFVPEVQASVAPTGFVHAAVPTAVTTRTAHLKPPVKAQVPLTDVVNSASATYHLDPDLVNSVIHAESGFNAHAVSPKGARGLMQLMPKTAGNLGVDDAFDPLANVTGGSRYLRQLLERYNFDLIKALAAYNAGPQRVEQYNGVPPFRETRAYVARIVHEYNTKKLAQEKLARQLAHQEEKNKNAATGVKTPATHKTTGKLHTAKPQTAAIATPSPEPIAR